MRAVILVVSDKEKDTSSTSGMETSRLTSPLLKYRATHVVADRLSEIETAYLAKDFETFGKITMQDSNQFHATCLDTYPPIFYMNDISKIVIRLVHVINTHYQSVKAAYTFDAGPNAVIYCLEKVSVLDVCVCTYTNMFCSREISCVLLYTISRCVIICIHKYSTMYSHFIIATLYLYRTCLWCLR